MHLALDGPGYAGVVRNQVTGQPYRHLRVFATPLEGALESELTTSTLTDGDGRFELRGLECVPHRLAFHPRASATGREQASNPFKSVFFEAGEPANDPPIELELLLP